MSEIVERVARAICAALSDEPWEELGPHWHGVYQTEARAAIEAMREPILDAISKVVSSRDDLGQTHFEELRDAINAALA